ncbi:uncharacterized protein LOC116198928 [Punica granatum]|uniref:Uncharacterized protein n=2 Tax=Punica granatum TaxID=22663 RepID=A0A218WMR4_PUNGR|nr:uncharacterized protein LOC116198928 [Punica granatum]OWM73640.1 hypothetical protein CDL15_Pgr026739 [Punica granatum]PKI53713.1 hypothetical protein CRG98_025954 [Punica granatum]
MAPRHAVAALLFALALASVELSTCIVLKGKVSCLDCHDQKTGLSGIKVLVKCDKIKKLVTATTKGNGYFETGLHSAHTSLPSSNCLAKVLGGPRPLYATRKSMVSKIVKAHDNAGRSYFTTSTPLAVSMACPKEKASNCGDSAKFGSSKTVDLPVPREWGLAPTSYYAPFIPIIGIP